MEFSKDKSQLYKSDLLLALLYLLLISIILFRVSVEGTGYLSPDSKAYLNLAQNLKDGQGFYVISKDGTGRHYFSTWPVGYPVLIYLVSEVSSLSPYWASKVLNLLLLGCGFLLIRHINRPYSFVLASVYGAYTFIEVYSFSWSEAPFLLLLLLLAYIADRIWQTHNFDKNLALLSLVCLALFLIRYVGAFSFGVPALLGIHFAYYRRYKPAAKLFALTLLLTILAGAYLYTNYTLSGFATGFNRLEDETEGARSFVLMLLKGLLNEFLVIREYRPSNQPDFLLYFTALFQVSIMVLVIIKVKSYVNFWKELQNNSFSLSCIGIALLYFIAILTLRVISHFDELDYRLLSPFSYLILIGLVYALVSLPDSQRAGKQAKHMLFFFFVTSLLLNMPKKYIISQLLLFL